MDNILKNKIYSSTLGMKIKEKVPRLPELTVGYLLYLSHMFLSKKYYSSEITLILIALSSLIDQHMWKISYNIIFLATFANLNSFSHSTKRLSI